VNNGLNVAGLCEAVDLDSFYDVEKNVGRKVILKLEDNAKVLTWDWLKCDEVNAER